MAINKPISVMSLFDGVSTALLSIEKAGLTIKSYYSSEIDVDALRLQDFHYSGDSRFHKIGDVREVDGRNYADVDIVIFGSPCMDMSAARKNRAGLVDGPQSSLFFEAIRVIKEIKSVQSSTRQLLVVCENVASMKREDRDRMSAELQEIFPAIKLLKIDSAIISPSHRRRYYWHNLKNVKPIKPNGIKLQDILINGYATNEDGKARPILSSGVTLLNGLRRFVNMGMGNVVFKNKEFADLPDEQKLLLYPDIIKESGYVAKAGSNKDEYAFPNNCYRLPSVLELERCLTFPDGYISNVPGISRTSAKSLIGLSFSRDIVAHILGGLK